MIEFVILGQPASKANNRKIVTIGGRLAVIKSVAARNYERDALRQIPPAARVRLQGPVEVALRIWYASERPDLDESVVLDVLQDRYSGNGEDRVLLQAGVYRNDRQVRRKTILHGIDRHNPRTEVAVRPLKAQQAGLLAALFREP